MWPCPDSPVCLGEHVIGCPTGPGGCLGQDRLRRLRGGRQGQQGQRKDKPWRKWRETGTLPWGGSTRRAPNRGDEEREFKDTNSACRPIPFPFLGSAEMATPFKSEIKKRAIEILPWAHPLLHQSGSCPHLQSLSSLPPSPSPWATTGSKRDRDGPKFS